MDFLINKKSSYKNNEDHNINYEIPIIGQERAEFQRYVLVP